jgi:branched-subunit amino acid aminotransferase/4-amino-4-deoxychorismate lyase
MSHPEPEGLVWIDGRLVGGDEALVPLGTPGVQSGVGVFETIAVRAGRPVDLDEHLARFERSGSVVGVPLLRREEIAAAVGEIARGIGSGHGWLKVVALREGRTAVFGGESPREEEGRPARAVLLPWRRSHRDPLAGVKSTSYAANVLGLEWARARGADEGLWRNDRGRLTEGCASNVFAIRGRAVFTPAVTEGILEGVTRAKAILAAKSLGLAVHEGSVRVPRLATAREAFLSSSLKGIRPLLSLDGRKIGTGEPGPWTAAIAAATARVRGIGLSEEEPAQQEAGGTG